MTPLDNAIQALEAEILQAKNGDYLAKCDAALDMLVALRGERP